MTHRIFHHLFCIAMIILFADIATATATAQETQWRLVAGGDATAISAEGKPPVLLDFVVAGELFTYSEKEIPFTALPKNLPERTIFFGKEVEFKFLGLTPKAKYQARAKFLSDSATRSQKIQAGRATLAENLKLPNRQVLAQTWDIPESACSGGELSLKVISLSGPNAVISNLEIWSNDPAPLKAAPAAFSANDAQTSIPRLSPRPMAVNGCETPLISLNGQWRFHPEPAADFQKLETAGAGQWKTIAVPGEWVMQGFTVKPNTAAAYWREFEIPADWLKALNRVKLRFDTVHSDCVVYVNGEEAGRNDIPFTPFELDVTRLAKPGKNTLALAVKSESLADVLASATQYAAHQLGGITRKVTLFAAPEINIASQSYVTEFGKDFKDATLHVFLEIANEGKHGMEMMAAKFWLEFDLKGADGKSATFDSAAAMLHVPVIKAGETARLEARIPVKAPAKWDPEHPNLYTLTTTLKAAQPAIQTISQRVGFRQIEVRGNQVFVNGSPIKMRGVNRHETHPLLSRSTTPELWRKDAEIFRAGNVNYIRTSHYPPAEEFLDACDELGLFVECEAPLCWVNHGANSAWTKWNNEDMKFFPYLAQANIRNVITNRNHPSVIIWSLANESRWSKLFARTHEIVRQLDPSRPTSFHDQSWGAYNNASSKALIANFHYPGPKDVKAKITEGEGMRPQLFGEYCHISAYNRREILTDPEVRDHWGGPFKEMVDSMYETKGSLGGAIWAGIDDVFHLPDGRSVGYGEWGVIDAWRRLKPEYWLMKNAYSPIRVLAQRLPVPGEGEAIKIKLENRFLFTDLSEVKIEWRLGNESGTVKAAAAPQTAAEISIQPKSRPQAGELLSLRFSDPRGFVCQEEALPIAEETNATSAAPGASVVPVVSVVPGAAIPQSPKAGVLSLTSTDDAYIIKGGQFGYEINRKTGQIRKGEVNGRTALVGGPVLMILPLACERCGTDYRLDVQPLNDPCKEWQASSVKAEETADSIVVKMAGEYAEAKGAYELHVDKSGGLTLDYTFASKKDVNPREAGMVFYAPKSFDTLSWRRKGLWTVYPADHIGRPIGKAKAFPHEPVANGVIRTEPKWNWSEDTTTLGSNDFRSSKANFFSAAINAPSGEGIAALSDGSQTARAFMDGERVGLLIAGINTGGGESFFNSHLAAGRRPLKNGIQIRDTIRLQLVIGK